MGIQVSCYLITVMLLLLKNNVTNILRNDMDVVGVRAGCTFTGFSGSDFDGNSVMVRAEQSDHWVVFDRFFLSIYLWLDVCPVFASLPLIRAN